ncbi:hypothetical protein ASPZODRAFT_19239 [Penicilliopsis zonata CBS 506.65]|uniref:Rhodopsin domain-containing protein n=1 Tax=Penicilliopsis zonata CBS 506.65 TaxID=1073090 RepID=A0A1L9S8M9_9EURO|nr:hypothetical protein ASPZODRAFT_19239 [Penicilliopsis zonata CBS 506.65]OJJ43516.1 hypothetical protein ASPZODRAFT_19239 [Penicilliopsis zonata CBS 506.65]
MDDSLLFTERGDNSKGSRVASILVCNGVLLAICTLGVVVRVYVRVRLLTGLAWDDLFCILGWIFTVVLCFFCMLMTRYGYGRHIGTITKTSTLDTFLKYDFVTELTYLLALASIKVSFSLFYLRIFPGRQFFWLCWGLIVLVVAETTEEMFVVIFQCSPIKKAWDASGTVPGHCLSLLAFYYISFGIRLATDIALFALPIPPLLKLRVSGGKRAGLLFMFSLGILVTMTSVVRATYLNNFSDDHTWTLVNPLNWSTVEVCVAIFIACLPSFKPLIAHHFPGLQRLLGLTSRGDSTAKMYGATTITDVRMTNLHPKTRSGSEERIIVTTDVLVNEEDQ